MLVDAKIVRADPDHPLATYKAGDEIEGPAAELQVALGHAQALPEIAAIAQEAAPTNAEEPSHEAQASQAAEASAAARAEDGA